MWLDDLRTLFEEANVATFGENLWFNTTSSPPILSSGYLHVTEQSGGSPERTQNMVIRPAYLNVAADVTAHAPDIITARGLAQSAFDAVVGIRNSWIISVYSSGWYREINPLSSEPWDKGVDDRKQARCGFTIIATKRR